MVIARNAAPKARANPAAIFAKPEIAVFKPLNALDAAADKLGNRFFSLSTALVTLAKLAFTLANIASVLSSPAIAITIGLIIHFYQIIYDRQPTRLSE